jgi:hypothetical protein
MKGRTHVIARDGATAVMEEYAANRERAIATLKLRHSVRVQQVEQKLKRDLRELKDGELQKMCVLQTHPALLFVRGNYCCMAQTHINRYALAPKLVVREASTQGSEGEDLQLLEKKFTIDRKMHALQQVGVEILL